MSRQRKIFVAVGCGIVACVLFVLLTREKEPTYGGKKLSEWVEMYDGRAMVNPSAADKRDADEALRHIGTNAVPYLLKCIDYERPAWKDTQGPIYTKMPKWLRNSRAMKWLFFDGKPSENARAAIAGFGALGPMGAPAIPELTRRVLLTNSPTRRRLASFALAGMGPAVVPTIQALISSPTGEHERTVMQLVRSLGTNAGPFVPILIQYLQHTNLTVAGSAAQTLGVVGCDPKLAVPALIKSLEFEEPASWFKAHRVQDPRDVFRMQVEESLAMFGNSARAAVPALLKAQHDLDHFVSHEATVALAKIAPELVTNAPTPLKYRPAP